MYAINTGAYYTDNMGQTHPIILDNQGRGFWRDQSGQSHKLTDETDNGHVYYINSLGKRQDLDVDQNGHIYTTNSVNNQDERVQLDQQGRAFYINNNQRNYLFNNESSFGGSAFSQGQTAGKLYYQDQYGNIHQIFVDNQGAYYIDSANQFHTISQQGRAFYVNQSDDKVGLLINQTGDVGVRQGGSVHIIKENTQGEGYFTNSFGQNVMLVNHNNNVNDFTQIMDRSQLLQQHKQSGGIFIGQNQQFD